MADIRHLLKIEAAPEQVYAALTTAEGIRSWWTDNAALDEQVGGKGVFRFHYGKVVETLVEIQILEPPKTVGWSVIRSFRPEQKGTLISFELVPDGHGVMLHFSQNGFPQADDTYALMNTGWAYYLVSLKFYAETGRGQPSPNVDFSILLRPA